jgi:hypothetical protein
MAKEVLQPHQVFYRAVQKRLGWQDRRGNFVWPDDPEERRARAVALFGLALVVRLDGTVHHAQDELFDTFDAPWADPKRVDQDERERRNVLATLTTEQRQAALDVIHDACESMFRGFCQEIDGFDGGALSIAMRGLNPADPEGSVTIQSIMHPELKFEAFEWLEEYSRIYGK